MKLDMEKYKMIRMAQAKGARTIDELKEMTDIVIENDEELKLVEEVLYNACRCMGVSIQEVVDAVNNGADTLEKIAKATGAGTACGRCNNGVLTSILENKR